MEIMKVSPPPPHPELISILQILSAANHRNKNQHRLSKWWKSFSQLRRQVAKLITELETFDQIEGMYGEGKKQTLASREVVERRVEFLVDVLGPKCYL
jgi:ribonuclease MRP protein subunit RMP1